MLEELAKNIWLLLTLVIPGLFTYGVWRAILLLEPSSRLSTGSLGQLDNSVLLTTSIIVAIALIQQAVALVAEAVLASLSRTMRRKRPKFYTLFCERFALAAAGKLNDNATRIIGNFFLSADISVGLGLLLIYFLFYESRQITHWIPIVMLGLLCVTLLSAVFRMMNAEWAINECKKEDHKKSSRGTIDVGALADIQKEIAEPIE